MRLDGRLSLRVRSRAPRIRRVPERRSSRHVAVRQVVRRGVHPDALTRERMLYRSDPRSGVGLDLRSGATRIVAAVGIALKVEPVGEALDDVRLDGRDVVSCFLGCILVGPRKVVSAGYETSCLDPFDVGSEARVVRRLPLARFGKSEGNSFALVSCPVLR